MKCVNLVLGSKPQTQCTQSNKEPQQHIATCYTFDLWFLLYFSAYEHVMKQWINCAFNTKWQHGAVRTKHALSPHDFMWLRGVIRRNVHDRDCFDGISHNRRLGCLSKCFWQFGPSSHSSPCRYVYKLSAITDREYASPDIYTHTSTHGFYLASIH